MSKMKTHKGLQKRVKRTAKGHLKRHRSYTSHLMANKTQKQKRNLRKSTLVSRGDMKRINQMIP